MCREEGVREGVRCKILTIDTIMVTARHDSHCELLLREGIGAQLKDKGAIYEHTFNVDIGGVALEVGVT